MGNIKVLFALKPLKINRYDWLSWVYSEFRAQTGYKDIHPSFKITYSTSWSIPEVYGERKPQLNRDAHHGLSHTKSGCTISPQLRKEGFMGPTEMSVTISLGTTQVTTYIQRARTRKVKVQGLGHYQIHKSSKIYWGLLKRFSRPDWMGLWVIWSSGRHHCPWQGGEMRWLLKFVPTQTIL